MSFHLLQLHKIEAMGGAPWQLHQELQARADQSAHDSPAVRQLNEFRALWLEDCNRAAEWARELIVARITAAEAAARATG
jgi:hypothetical protein